MSKSDFFNIFKNIFYKIKKTKIRPNESFLEVIKHFPMVYYMKGSIEWYFFQYI
jgi:hypothetical protein